MVTHPTRREFLAALGAGGLAVVAGGWYAQRLLAMVNEGTLPAPRGPGLETWVPTVCRLCPAACGLRVRLVDRLPVGLEGNRTSPVSAGGLCPAGLAGLQELVHPDRLRTPMRRNGARGAGSWKAISWDEALDEIANRLRRLRDEGRPQAFAVLERGDSPLTQVWLERVMGAFGSPNLILDGTNEAWRLAWADIAGAERVPAIDLAHSDFILSFGHELFETDGHPVWQTKAWGQLRAPSVPRPATLAYVGSRISPSASRADLRVAIRPGEETTMALGLLHVLIVEELVNRPFVERWTDGFGGPGRGEGREGLESFVRRHYTPEEVSRRTAAPVSEILRLGRALGAAQRPVALVGSSALHREDALAAASAVVALNLALGAVGRAGGYVAAGDAPVGLPAAVDPDVVARRGLAAPRVDGAGVATLAAVRHSPANLVAHLEEGKPYPLDVLLVHGVNPAHEWPDGKSIARALDRVPLLVAMAGVPDETAALADIILPEASFLESWNLLPSAHALPLGYVGLQQPVVGPLYGSRSFEDVWFALGRRIGGPAAALVPPGSYGEWLPEAAAGLFQANRGTLSTGTSGERIASFIETRGWKVEGPASPAAFWGALCESAGWVDSPDVGRSPVEVLGRGVGRFSFREEPFLRDLQRLTGPSVTDGGPDAGREEVATAAPSGGTARGAYPFDLLLFDTNTLWRGRTALTPLLLELTGAREDIAWDSWVEIHPVTAERLGICAGDRVRLESAAGSLVTRARLAPVVPRDAVAMPRGLGHRHYGRFANGVGANPATLLPARSDPRTGAPVLVTRVRLTPARA
jgi:anaerobic selenocysteine-containing dehydrogenase